MLIKWFKGLHRRQQLTIYFVLLTLAGAALIWMGLDTYLSRNKFEFYQSSTYGFKMKYPIGWEVKENYEGAAVVFISPKEGKMDLFRENITVVIQDLAGRPMPLRKYTDVAIRQILAILESQIDIVESKPATLAGKPAHRFSYTGKVRNSQALQFLHIWSVIGDTAYQVNITAQQHNFDKDRRLYNAIIRSFRRH